MSEYEITRRLLSLAGCFRSRLSSEIQIPVVRLRKTIEMQKKYIIWQIDSQETFKIKSEHKLIAIAFPSRLPNYELSRSQCVKNTKLERLITNHSLLLYI